MEIEVLTSAKKTIGAKQTSKAIMRGEVRWCLLLITVTIEWCCPYLNFVRNTPYR